MSYLRIIPVAFFLSIAFIARGEDAKVDPKMFDGTWLPVSAELAGKNFPDEVLKTMKLVLKGDTYTVTVGEGVDKGTVKIDASKKPAAMDITGTDGPNKGKTFLAIYEVTKDSMKVCYDLSGKERPTEFKTKADTKLFLAEYKRETK